MKKLLFLMILLMAVSTGLILADGEVQEDEFLALIPITAIGMVLAISTLMHGMKKWWDSQDKLKPYWIVFAVAFSLVGGTIISAITGFDWASQGSYLAWTAQVLLIYGGQHLFEQAWFKRWWPTIKSLVGLFLKFVLKKK